jgi:hypothetical protein
MRCIAEQLKKSFLQSTATELIANESPQDEPVSAQSRQLTDGIFQFCLGVPSPSGIRFGVLSGCRPSREFLVS